jgi:hypothetical protein
MAELTVALSGDCMVTRGSLITDDPDSRAVRDLLAGVDVAVTNLEFVPDCGAGFPVNNEAGGGCLIADGAAVDEARLLGFTAFGCANNHALDLGPAGLLGTVDLLHARGIPFAGIGRDLASARTPAFVDTPSGSVAVLSCSATFLPGQEASNASPQVRARPGLSPLRHGITLRVTAEHLRVLREIDTGTGLRGLRAEAVALLGVDPVDLTPRSLSMFGARFEAADRPGLAWACDPADLDEIAEWVRHARQRADVVLVSVHCHEPGDTPEQPAPFLDEFARRAVDAGADAVMGHGPHFLRGVRIHRGRPIFYSLGNIVSQIELAERVPAEDYAKVPAAERTTPSRYFAARSLNGRRLFARHRKYWETVLPVLTFGPGGLARVEVHPVELGFDQPAHRRGRPRLARGEQGTAILRRFADLCAPFGTTVQPTESGTGRIVLSSPDDPSPLEQRDEILSHP